MPVEAWRCSETAVCRYPTYPSPPSRAWLGEMWSPHGWGSLLVAEPIGWLSAFRKKSCVPQPQKSISWCFLGRKGCFIAPSTCSCCGLTEMRLCLLWVVNKAEKSGRSPPCCGMDAFILYVMVVRWFHSSLVCVARWILPKYTFYSLKWKFSHCNFHFVTENGT